MIIGGKYEVLDALGRGGMGTVYRVRHQELGAIFALKTLHPHWLGEADSVRRFYREARVIAQLRHPHIVKVFDIGQDGDRHYFVMEYVQGRALNEILAQEGPLPLARVLAISRQVARALSYAHARQPSVVHRDIKPHNILIEEDTERVVVMDFGIAKLLDERPTQETGVGVFIGTPAYSAPEQMRGDLTVDGRTDIFSLGLVMYEMAAGRKLFAGLSQQEIVGKQLYETHEYALAFDQPVPVAFRQLVAKAVAKDRNRRFATAAALLEALDKVSESVTPWPRSPLSLWLSGAALIGFSLLATRLWLPEHLVLVKWLQSWTRSADLAQPDQPTSAPEPKPALESPPSPAPPSSASVPAVAPSAVPPAPFPAESISNSASIPAVAPSAVPPALPPVEVVSAPVPSPPAPPRAQRSLEEELTSQFNLESTPRTEERKPRQEPAARPEPPKPPFDPAQGLEQALRRGKAP